MTNILRSYRNRRNTRTGAHGQTIAAAALVRMGLVCVTPIETGWAVTRAGGKIVGAKPKAKVPGDIRAVQPGTGRSVLVEVKTRDDGVLSWGDLEKHQHEALREHEAAGAIGLVALVVGHQVYIAPYEGLILRGWAKGRPVRSTDEGMWMDEQQQRFA